MACVLPFNHGERVEFQYEIAWIIHKIVTRNAYPSAIILGMIEKSHPE
jgi:hypothetical protein